MLKKMILLGVMLGLLFWTGSAINTQAEELSGTITIAGSTSVQPISDELAKAFMAKNPKVKIFVQGGGSGAGIKAAMNGTADIGASSRELKTSEKGLNEITIAKDGITIIVNTKNNVKNLSMDQVKAIFAGKIKDWKDVGGRKGRIIVVNREAGSGTRGAFEEIVMDKENPLTNDCLVQASTGAVKSTVTITREAIGYVSLAALDNDVKPLSVDGVVGSEANIINKSYKIARPFLYLTKTEPTGVVKAYFDFVLSPEGQSIVAKDLIAVRPTK